MHIDTRDGSIRFEAGVLDPGLDRAGFLASGLGRAARQEPVGEWLHLHLKPEPGVAANIQYRGDRLYRALVLMEIAADARREWTEANELERKRVHDGWLRDALGAPPWTYAWGSIASEYDARGCVSEIIVLYEK